MKIEEVYKTIDIIIASQKKARHTQNYLLLMENAEALLEYMPSLINYSVEQESEYRKYEARLADGYTDSKRNSGSYCETQAKATEEYKNWRKAEKFIDLMYEMVNIAKKLAGSVDKELNASTK